MRKPNPRAVRVVIASIAVGGLIVLGASSIWRAPGEAPAVGIESAAPRAAPQAQKPPTTSAPAPVALPLPPPDAPLRESIAALDQAARRGDAKAACRLAGELRRCRVAARWEGELRTSPQTAADFGLSMNPEATAEFDRVQARRRGVMEAAIEHCRGVEREHFATDAAYLSMAAAAGHRPSQIEFIAGHHLQPAAMLADPSQLQVYRANANRYFTNALEAGDLAVLRPWREATESDQAALRAFLPEAWLEPGFFAALFARLTPEQQISVQQHLRISQEIVPTAAQTRAADELFDRYFADSTPVPGHVRPPDEGNETVLLNEQFSLAPMRCDEPPGG